VDYTPRWAIELTFEELAPTNYKTADIFERNNNQARLPLEKIALEHARLPNPLAS
jgi:hypothetical protein